jgi:hypothetical protein
MRGTYSTQGEITRSWLWFFRQSRCSSCYATQAYLLQTTMSPTLVSLVALLPCGSTCSRLPPCLPQRSPHACSVAYSRRSPAAPCPCEYTHSKPDSDFFSNEPKDERFRAVYSARHLPLHAVGAEECPYRCRLQGTYSTLENSHTTCRPSRTLVTSDLICCQVIASYRVWCSDGTILAGH